MSFDYNPFQHLDILLYDREEKPFQLLCHGCGKEIPIEIDKTIPMLFDLMAAHLRESHKVTLNDFTDWSIE